MATPAEMYAGKQLLVALNVELFKQLMAHVSFININYSE